MENQRKKIAGIVSKIVPQFEVDDVVQDTLIRAWRFRNAFRGDSEYNTWLYRIAINTALQYLRNSKRQIQTTSLEDWHQISFEYDPLIELEYKIIKDELQKAIEKLSDNHKIVINMFYFKNYSCEEIAEKLKCPVGTVWSRLHYAHKKLKNLLKWHEYCIINNRGKK